MSIWRVRSAVPSILVGCLLDLRFRGASEALL